MFATKNEGVVTMTDNELKLIELIRENDKPDEALMAAVIIVLGFLNRHGSDESEIPASPLALC